MSKWNKILPYSRQLIDADDIQAVIEVLQSDFLTQGPRVADFEKALAEYCGSAYAVAVATGTAALHAAYFAAGIGKGDDVITSPITFAATANAALYLGARPLFADVEPDTGNIDPARVSSLITERTRAILPVHYSGQPVDLDAIHAIAREKKLIVIEDACHAIGSTYKGQKIGALSDMTVFSFHPVKPITTGEGGAILTNNSDYYEKLRIFREHGITRDKNIMHTRSEGDWYYEMHHLGFNFRITEIQSALGISQLRKIDRFIARRQEIADYYINAFRDNPWFETPEQKSYVRSSWHLFPIRLRSPYIAHRKEIFKRLRQNNLWVQVHYIPVYWHPYYQRLGYSRELCPIAEDFYAREISLPIFQGMTADDIKAVVSIITEVFQSIKQ